MGVQELRDNPAVDVSINSAPHYCSKFQCCNKNERFMEVVKGKWLLKDKLLQVIFMGCPFTEAPQTQQMILYRRIIIY